MDDATYDAPVLMLTRDGPDEPVLIQVVPMDRLVFEQKEFGREHPQGESRAIPLGEAWAVARRRADEAAGANFAGRLQVALMSGRGELIAGHAPESPDEVRLTVAALVRLIDHHRQAFQVRDRIYEATRELVAHIRNGTVTMAARLLAISEPGADLDPDVLKERAASICEGVENWDEF